MLRAYVGVASLQGLAVLQPERDDTCWAVRRHLEEHRRRVGFWAVLGDDDARAIERLVCRGYRREALRLLDQCAKELGRILPRDAEFVRPH